MEDYVLTRDQASRIQVPRSPQLESGLKKDLGRGGKWTETGRRTTKDWPTRPISGIPYSVQRNQCIEKEEEKEDLLLESHKDVGNGRW